MKSSFRLIVCALALVSAGFSFSRVSADEEAPALREREERPELDPQEREQQRVKQRIIRNLTKAFGYRKDGHFVFATGEVTVAFQGGEHGYGERRGEFERPREGQREGGGREGGVQPKWNVHVIEGREEAMDFVATFLMSAPAPNVMRDWRFIARFKPNEREQAEAAAAQLQQGSDGAQFGRREGERPRRIED